MSRRKDWEVMIGLIAILALAFGAMGARVEAVDRHVDRVEDRWERVDAKIDTLLLGQKRTQWLLETHLGGKK